MTEVPEVGAGADVPPKAGAGLLLDAEGKLKEGEVTGAGGLKENEVVAAGMPSAAAAGAEGEVAAAWGLPKLKELLELSIVGQAKELKL